MEIRSGSICAKSTARKASFFYLARVFFHEVSSNDSSFAATQCSQILLLAKIVNGADTDNSLWNQPEAAGLNAIAEGFRHLGFKEALPRLEASQQALPEA
jgi:hypothetical protein